MSRGTRTLALAALLALPAAAPRAAVGQMHGRTPDLIGVAQQAGQFRTLLAALDAAGLTATLQGKGPFTVFAPTDEAFRKLPAGTVEALLKPENREKLRTILTYHVVAGKVPAEQARTLRTATTVAGPALRISTDGAALRINQATVTAADVAARNGVIHVIDQVLMPPAEVGSARALEVIDLAIQRGVPLFNDGDPAATAAIYEVAARAVVALGDEVPPAARASLAGGIEHANRTHEAGRRAWVLRHALDRAADALEERMEAMALR